MAESRLACSPLQAWQNLHTSSEAISRTNQSQQMFVSARSSESHMLVPSTTNTTATTTTTSSLTTTSSSSSSSTSYSRIVDSSTSSSSSARLHEYISRGGHDIVEQLKRFFHCPYCSQKMTSKGSLVRHIRSHTGERPYQCSYCSYAALQKSDLDRHARNRHRDQF